MSTRPAARDDLGAGVARATKARHVVLGILCLLYLISYLDRTTIGVAAPKIIAEFHWSKATMGWIFSAFAWTYALLQIIGGTMGDRYGPRRVLTILMTWWSAFTVLTGFAVNFASMFVIRLLFGLGEAGGFPVSTQALATWYPPRDRGMLQGITHAFARVGGAVSPPIVVWLTIVLGGWRPSFWILGAIGFLWSAAFFWIYRDFPSQKKAVNALELREIYGPSGAPPPRPAKHRVPWGEIFSNRNVLLLVLADFCYGYSLWIYISWLPTYYTTARHFSFKEMGFVAFFPFFGGVIGDLVGGYVTDTLWKRTRNLNLARRGTSAVAFFGAMLFTVPGVLVPSAIGAVALQTGAFFFLECAVSCLWAMSMDLGGRRFCGSVSGLMNTGFGAAGIVSPVIFGYMVDRTGSWVIPFLVGAGLLVVGIVAILLLDATKGVDQQLAATEAAA